MLIPIPFIIKPAVVGGGGASGNFTFSIAQSEGQLLSGTTADPKARTFASSITAGNLLVTLMGERSGDVPASHSVTDNNGKTWTRVGGLDIDNSVGGDEINTRMSFSVWWREVDASGETNAAPTVTADSGSNPCDLAIYEISPSAAYDWTVGGTSIAGSGAADWNDLNSGNAAATGNDILPIYVAAARCSSDNPAPHEISFDEQDAGTAYVAGSNQLAFVLGIKTTSQADSSNYSGTVASTGTGNEGVSGTLLMKDGA